MEIAAGVAEEDAADGGQHRIAEIAMQGKRHGAGLDAAQEAVAHHQRVSLPQLGHKGIEIFEIITVIAIGHDDEAAARGANAGDQRRAIAALGHGEHARAQALGDLLVRAFWIISLIFFFFSFSLIHTVSPVYTVVRLYFTECFFSTFLPFLVPTMARQLLTTKNS